MDIKLKSVWIYQGKKYNPGDVAKDVPEEVIKDISNATPPVEFEEVTGKEKPVK